MEYREDDTLWVRSKQQGKPTRNSGDHDAARRRLLVDGLHSNQRSQCSHRVFEIRQTPADTTNSLNIFLGDSSAHSAHMRPIRRKCRCPYNPNASACHHQRNPRRRRRSFVVLLNANRYVMYVILPLNHGQRTRVENFNHPHVLAP